MPAAPRRSTMSSDAVTRVTVLAAVLGLLLTAGALVACSSGDPANSSVVGGAGSGSGSPSGGRPGAGGSTGPSGSATPAAGKTPTPTRPATAGSGSCPIFPANSIWHADVSHLPVLSSSAAYVSSIGSSAKVHADFGAGTYDGGPIGIPITTVPAGQSGAKVSFEYADESDAGPYPIPAGAKIEGGSQSSGDRHVILYDPNRCRSYELFAARPNGDGTWRAGSGAIFDLRGNVMRPRGWTSADAAGLSILAGLVRYDEVAAGRIDHAIRVTAPSTRNAYVWPATHAASSSGSASLPPMGLRLRLKSTVDISRLPTQARVVAQAMKTYGVIVADQIDVDPANR